MTAYCTVTEALSLLGNFEVRNAVAYSAGPPVVAAVTATEPTATQADTLLAQVTSQIDMHLRGQGYVVPVPDPEALASLQAIAMNGTAAKIAKARWPNDTGPGGEGGLATMLRADYEKGLADIDAGMLGPDATPEGDSGTAYNFTRTYDVLGSALNASDNVAPF